MMSKPAHKIEFRVPYGDIDWLGHVNNAKYLTYFETARAELMYKTFGGETGARWLSVIIAHAEIDYRAAAKWNDLLLVKMRPSSIGNSSWVYEYEIERRDEGGENTPIASGKTVQVSYDYDKGKSVRIRDDVRSILMKQIEETKET